MDKKLKNCILFGHLAALGDFYPLSIYVNPSDVKDQLQEFEDDWKEYNPKKVGFRRFGLSVTSLDGGLGGVPDLTSVFEYNKEHGSNYDELSFNQPTKVFKNVTAINPVLDPFGENIGRSHFLKFGEGGFFPFHRDSQFLGEDTFRIFVPLYMHGLRDFVFILGDKMITLEAGTAYFINTKIQHALFSFCEESIHLVINVALNEETVNKVVDLLVAN